MEFCAQPSRNDTEVFAAPLRSKFLAYAAYGIRIGLETTLDVIPYLSSPLIPGAELDASEPPAARFRFQPARSENGDLIFQVSGESSEVFSSGNIEASRPGTVGRSGTDGDAGRAGTGYRAYFAARGGSPACARGSFGFPGSIGCFCIGAYTCHGPQLGLHRVNGATGSAVRLPDREP